MPPGELSLLEASFDGEDGNHCGYCSTGASYSTSFWAHRLTAPDFQLLLDAGWRRSGRLLHRPNNARTCCPSFSIRLDVEQFAPSREHRRLQRRLRAILAGEEGEGDRDEGGPGGEASEPPKPQPQPQQRAQPPPELVATAAALTEALSNAASGLGGGSSATPRVRPLSPRSQRRLPQGTVLTSAYAHALAARGATPAQAVAEALVRPKSAAAFSPHAPHRRRRWSRSCPPDTRCMLPRGT